MYGYRQSSWEDALIGEGVALVVALAIIALAVVVTVIVATITEAGRIIKASSSYSEERKRIVRVTLLGFATLVLVCGPVAVAFPAAAGVSIYTVAWSFLLAVLVIEICDWRERKEDRGDELDTYLDFGGIALGSTGTEGLTTNGHHAETATESLAGLR